VRMVSVNVVAVVVKVVDGMGEMIASDNEGCIRMGDVS